jgi:FkbM family methyltransferase
VPNWSTKPLGRLPVIGDRLTRLDPRFEHYTPRTVGKLIGEVGVKGVIDRVNDQIKLRKVNRVLQALASNRQDVFFVQIGAYDGQTNDHLYPHIDRNRHWGGLVVEPISRSYQKLAETYGDRPNVKTVQAAVHESAEDRTMYRVNGPGSAAQRLGLLSTFDRELLLSKGWMAEGGIGDDIVEESVQCATLPALLETHGVEQVDILEIDVEGLDGIVLDQFDVERFRPAVIMFEHDNMPGVERERHAERLAGAGYSLVGMSVDTFCYI